MKKAILTAFAVFCLLSTLLTLKYRTSVKASPNVIYVPTEYPTIQQAIDNATPEDTIFVFNGTYDEHIMINKSVTLMGEDRNSTIIDGGETGTVVSITADNVTITGFTVRRSSHLLDHSGVFVDSSRNNISHNKIRDNYYGVYLLYSNDNVISNNDIVSNSWDGIYLESSTGNAIFNNNASSNGQYGVHLHASNDNVLSNNNASSNLITGVYLYSSNDNLVSDNDLSYNVYYGAHFFSSTGNRLSGNRISDNNYGIQLHTSSDDNIIYHNNFLKNKNQVWSDSMNTWNDNDEGNHWSDYLGSDPDRDGIGDDPYRIDANNQDNYPLMGIFRDFSVMWKDQNYHVTIISNSTISDFKFEVETHTGNRIMVLNVVGEANATGFCRAVIPAELMNYSLLVLVDGEDAESDSLTMSDISFVGIYFTYDSGPRVITIISSKILNLYAELLNKHIKLQNDFNTLNSTYHELLNSYRTLLGNYTQLLQTYNSLNATYGELSTDYGTLLGNYTQLLQTYNISNSTIQKLLGNYTTLIIDYNKLIEDYSKLETEYATTLSQHTENIRSLAYVFVATTTVLIAAIVYLSTRAHKRISKD